MKNEKAHRGLLRCALALRKEEVHHACNVVVEVVPLVVAFQAWLETCQAYGGP